MKVKIALWMPLIVALALVAASLFVGGFSDGNG